MIIIKIDSRIKTRIDRITSQKRSKVILIKIRMVSPGISQR